MATLTKKTKTVKVLSSRTPKGDHAPTPGPHWSSFEQFRLRGQAALKSVGGGAVGTLATRNGQFRVLSEEDFQRLYGQARDAERVQSALRVVTAAARTAHRHRDESSLETLMEAIALLAQSPALPVSSRFEDLHPEGLPLDEEETDVEMDPSRVARPYSGQRGE